MKTIKKAVLFLLMLSALLTVCLPVSADVIIEPVDDFFKLHEKECTYNNNRMYIVNTEAGHAYLYTAPLSGVTLGGFSNGEQVMISWTWTDASGALWGIRARDSGWFRMDDLTVIYDSFSFVADHEAELTSFEKGSVTIEADRSKPVLIWKYPGHRTGSMGEFVSGDVTDGVSKVYTDKKGNEWGYISYYYGSRNVWISLTDPYGEKVGEMTEQAPVVDLLKDPTAPGDIPTVTVNGQEIPLKATPTPAEDIPMSEENKNLLIIAGTLVGGVVLVTGAVLALVFVKKKKVQKE